MHLVPHGVTHIKSNSSTHIDLCKVDANDKIIEFTKSEGPFVHHHFLFFVVLELFAPSPTKADLKYRNLDKIDLGAFHSSLRSFDWSQVIDMNNVEEMIEIVETNILTTLNAHALLITITSRRKFEPWITPDINLVQQETNYLYRRYNRIKSANYNF